jgi:hypothetical protein
LRSQERCYLESLAPSRSPLASLAANPIGCRSRVALAPPPTCKQA